METQPSEDTVEHWSGTIKRMINGGITDQQIIEELANRKTFLIQMGMGWSDTESLKGIVENIRNKS